MVDSHIAHEALKRAANSTLSITQSIINRTRDTKVVKPRHEVIRTFSKHCDENTLLWHKDDEDRIVTVLNYPTNWYIQFDNELPRKLKQHDVLRIDKGVYHRLIHEAALHIGNRTKLVVRIEKI